MASSICVCSRLHLMGGRIGLAKGFKQLDAGIQRRLGTSVVVAARDEPLKKDVALTEQRGEYKSFDERLAERLEEAERSVLISLPNKSNEKKVLKYLSRHGDINKCFFYENYGTYAVVEYANTGCIASLHEGTAVPSVNHESMVPFKSRLLSLRSLGPVDPANSKAGVYCQPQTTIPINLLVQKLSGEESIGQQITTLKEAYQLTEENTRLRFLVCSLLKDIAAAYFPECTIRPFGSSVNGFGKLGCDLDMFLDLDGISGRNMKLPKAGFSLEYQMKQANSERAVTQNILSVIGACVNHFGAGCVGVIKILNARCPLVRFSHQPSGFQCDLTANNRVAMKSTELLSLYAELDQRVRSLVFAVRCWARVHGITSSIPGAWITNFSLTVMVLFFLQRRCTPIIPTLSDLRDLAGPADRSVIEGNDCTFVSDFTKIRRQGNTETSEQLLCEFFEFYATFPFNQMSINIRKGKEQNKPEEAPLHIQNPFEPSLNVSRNVNVTQLGRFVTLCQESSWLLQQAENKAPQSAAGAATATPWGLANLLLPSQEVKAVKSRKARKREPASERIKSLLDSLKKKS